RHNRRTDELAHGRDEPTQQTRADDFKFADAVDCDNRFSKARAHRLGQSLPRRIAQHATQPMVRVNRRAADRDNGGAWEISVPHVILRSSHPMTFAIFSPSRIILSSVFLGRSLMESYQCVSVSRNSSWPEMRSRTSAGVSVSLSRSLTHSRRKASVGSI